MLPDALTAPAREVAQRLVARNESLAVAESSAGGLISASLLSVPGASAFYRGGVVVYSLKGATAMLGGGAVVLPPGTRSSSEPFAGYLAAAVAAQHDADWAIGETGAAGPTGNGYGDPAGHAWTAVVGPDAYLVTEHVLTGDPDRAGNMEAFAASALRALAAALRPT